MAAFTGTPTSAPTYAAQIDGTKADAARPKKTLRSGVYTHTAAAGTGTGSVNLMTLPAGKIRVYAAGSIVNTTAFGAAADLHLGYRAYVGADGVTVVEDDNAFGDNLDVGGGALAADAFTLPAPGYIDFDSRDGVTVFAMIDAGDIEAGDTIEIEVEFSELS